jgi:hypothetical protein
MSTTNAVRAFIFGVLTVVSICCASPRPPQSGETLEQRIKKVMDRPEFSHSRFGLKFIAADT